MAQVVVIGEILVEIMATRIGQTFLESGLFAGPYPSGAPVHPRLEPQPDGTHLVRVSASDVDADLLALEPLIEAAYAQNG